MRGPEPMATIQPIMNAAETQIASEAPTAPTLAPETQSESKSPIQEDKVVKKETFTAEPTLAPAIPSELKSQTKEDKVMKKDETFTAESAPQPIPKPPPKAKIEESKLHVPTQNKTLRCEIPLWRSGVSSLM